MFLSTLERLFTYIRANQFSHVSTAAFRRADVYEFKKLISAFVPSAPAARTAPELRVQDYHSQHNLLLHSRMEADLTSRRGRQ